ncbi:MAG: TA system VapC family ribonuclease toxin [Acidobacteriota bacterium]|jgi:toxin-antitoxin system PIN domain toxin
MISFDTNILLYAQNRDCSEHSAAFEFLVKFGSRGDVVICELVLVELYLLLRNPAVVSKPLSAKEATGICSAYRMNPHWRLVESAPVMDRVWKLAAEKLFPRRRIIDARLAFTLQHHGVDSFATANVHDFAEFGFLKVWNPLRDE